MMVRKKLIDESGYATIASSGIIIAVVVLLAAVAVIISRVVAFHQAQVAADMAAISGAYSLVRGEDGCAEAARIALANAADLDQCTAQGADIQVA
ncbi:Rv3654c family TadE-like protein, partial [Corynebacterium stationis]|uniref:Rv3654c family TadE-like protein n=1 Tax=Corynebacterium stationis TaxID=1705 RepID=UPI00241D7934